MARDSEKRVRPAARPSAPEPRSARRRRRAAKERPWLEKVPLWRVGAVVAAVVMAIASRGDVFILAALLGAAAARVSSGMAAGLAAASVVARFGSADLGALAGAQAVLGGAGWTGEGGDPISSWLAAGAIVASATTMPVEGAHRLRLLPAVAFGTAAAAVVAGPGPGGPLAVRVLASVAGTAVAAAVAAAREQGSANGVAAAVAPALGAAAVAAALVGS